MTTYRTPGREVDETEIERAKIHEEAETKRKHLEEREKTRRQRIETLGPIPAALAAAVAAVAIIAGAISFHNHLESKAPPKPPEPCIEIVEIIGRSTDIRQCRNGGRIETTTLPNNDVLWRCICAPKDGGT